MNTKDLPVLLFGIGIVCIAYMMKKSRFEGFQPAGMPTATPMGAAGPPPMAPPPMGAAGMPPMAPPPMGAPPPMPPPPPVGAQPPMAPPPMGAAPMPPAAPSLGMKPNQQQLMDLSTRVQQMASEQGAIASQLQQITQSFGTEGFQSYKNPYNAASPGDTQAMEFRLGKKALLDSVVRY